MGLNRFQLLLISIAVFFLAVSAKNTAPAPAVDCSTLVLEMADCLSFVMAGSTTQTPGGTCCEGLKTVLKTDAECLCETFRNSAQLGVTLNMTKAVALPSACHVSAPSVSNCALTAGTGAAPGLSPVQAPMSSVAGAPSAGVFPASDVSPAPAPTGVGASGSTNAAGHSTTIGFFTLTTIVAAVSFCLL